MCIITLLIFSYFTFIMYVCACRYLGNRYINMYVRPTYMYALTNLRSIKRNRAAAQSASHTKILGTPLKKTKVTTLSQDRDTKKSFPRTSRDN